jgi:hypothetical protein
MHEQPKLEDADGQTRTPTMLQLRMETYEFHFSQLNVLLSNLSCLGISYMGSSSLST